MANGFVTSRPAARHGDSQGDAYNGYPWAGRWQAPGSGELTISEIGGWFSQDSGSTTIKMKICEDDAANGCPGPDVANSLIDVTSDSGSMAVKYGTYGDPKPVVTGGNWYWICASPSNTFSNWDYLSGGSRSGLYVVKAYPDWPTETEWHTHTDYNYDYGLYAVYSGGGGGLSIPVAMDIYKNRRVN